MDKYSTEKLNTFSKSELVGMMVLLQDQMCQMNDNIEELTEQIRVLKQYRFGRHTEKLDDIVGQLSLFNEAEAYADDGIPEPAADDVIISIHKKKQRGKRDDDFKDLPHEVHEHKLTDAQLDDHFGKDCWRRMSQEKFIRVRCQPAAYTVEDHIVDVAVGTTGDHQDEFLRGDRPRDLLRNSVVTPSLMAAIWNSKYVNAQPLYRIENQFRINGVNISRQTMANWTIRISEKYLRALWYRLKEEQLKGDVLQADETRVQVINDNDPNDPYDIKGKPGHTNYMWVHRSGEFEKEHPTVLYEYQRTRHHKYPYEYYNGFNGVLMTDGLQQYHMLEKEIPGFINANCWAHARHDYADAVKAAKKDDPDSIKHSVAYQALVRIAAIYKLEDTFKDLRPEERLKKRKETIAPLVEEYFAWVKARLADNSALPKGKAADGLKYSINQERYLRVFLSNGNVPIDDSASERAIRPFTIGRKNWVLIDSIKGAQASADIYSIVETAKANNLNPYYYMDYLLTELPKYCDEDGNIDTDKMDPLLPWADELPQCCKNKRR